MHIWLAPSAFFPARGGVEELTLQLARQYRELGHDVTVVVHRHPASLPARDRIEGIPVIRLGMDLPGRSPGRLLSYPASLLGQARRLGAIGSCPDVVHVQCPANQMPAMVAYTRGRRVPLIVTTQGEVTMDAAGIYQHSIQMRTSLRVGARAAAALTGCSRRAAADAAAIARPFVRAAVIPNGIDPRQWSLTPVPPEPSYAVWCRHVPQKGIDLLIEAFAEVRRRHPQAILRIGGEGSETPRLRAMSGPGVEFLGPLNRDGVRDLLARTRVAVVPSRLEPFGIVAVEAMACGRGVVWSTNGGLAEATGGLGWGVDPTDRSALTGALLDAHENPVDPVRAREHAESLAWARIAERYLGTYAAAARR